MNPLLYPFVGILAMVAFVVGILLPGELAMLVALAFTDLPHALSVGVIAEGSAWGLAVFGIFGMAIAGD